MEKNAQLTIRQQLSEAALSSEQFLARNPRPVLLHDRRPVILHHPVENAARATFETIGLGAARLQTSPGHPMRELSAQSLDWEVRALAKRTEGVFEGVITCGRASNNDLVLPYADVSKMHAYFTVPAPGSPWVLCDNGSRNGTIIEGVRLELKGSLSLADDAHIMFGQYPFLFMAPAKYHALLQSLAARHSG